MNRPADVVELLAIGRGNLAEGSVFDGDQIPARRTGTPKDILSEIKKVAIIHPQVRKVFLADGDALVLSTSKLLKILQALRDHFPQLQRVSSYALASNLVRKPVEELKQLRDAGLKLIYLGIESGDDEVLKRVKIPTLIIAGQWDHVTPLKVMKTLAKRIGNSEFLIVPHGSHCTLLDQPELLNLKTEEFLKNLEEKKSLKRDRPPGHSPGHLIDTLISEPVSSETVVPLEVTVIPDLVDALAARGCELRVTPGLWPLRNAIIKSTVQFSISRFRNATPE